jgi:hypothetical protein
MLRFRWRVALCLLALSLIASLSACGGSDVEVETAGASAEYTAEEIVTLVSNDLTMARGTVAEQTAAGLVEGGASHRWAGNYEADTRAWTVELVLFDDAGITDVYRWRVTDFNARISFLGIFRGSTIEPN